MPETEKNQDKQNNQKSKVPPRITNALKNAEKTLSNLNQKLKSLNLKDFNDIVAMENIIRLLDANDTIKNERNVKRRASRNGSSVKVNNSYSVIVANDDLSKNLISLIRRVTQLSNNELENIQESFLTNKIDDIVSSLDSSKNLIDDTKDVVSVLMKYFSAKNTTKYEKELILKDLEKYHGFVREMDLRTLSKFKADFLSFFFSILLYSFLKLLSFLLSLSEYKEMSNSS